MKYLYHEPKTLMLSLYFRYYSVKYTNQRLTNSFTSKYIVMVMDLLALSIVTCIVNYIRDMTTTTSRPTTTTVRPVVTSTTTAAPPSGGNNHSTGHSGGGGILTQTMIETHGGSSGGLSNGGSFGGSSGGVQQGTCIYFPF